MLPDLPPWRLWQQVGVPEANQDDLSLQTTKAGHHLLKVQRGQACLQRRVHRSQNEGEFYLLELEEREGGGFEPSIQTF